MQPLSLEPRTMSSEEVRCRKAAEVAFRNAHAILADADLLYQHARWPRAVSLSVIGQEELGKALVYTVAALELLPGLRKTFSTDGFANPARDHEFKQLTADMAVTAHYMIEDLVWMSDGTSGPYSEIEWINAVLREFVEWLAESGVAQGSGARRVYIKRRKQFFTDIKKRLSQKVLSGASGTVEEKKWRGFYVDFLGASLWDPSSLSERDARLMVGELRINLEALKLLGTALQDDYWWAQLKR